MPSNKSNTTTSIGDDISINQLQVNMQKMLSDIKSVIARVKVSIKEEMKKLNSEIILIKELLSFLFNKFNERAAKIKNYEEN